MKLAAHITQKVEVRMFEGEDPHSDVQGSHDEWEEHDCKGGYQSLAVVPIEGDFPTREEIDDVLLRAMEQLGYSEQLTIDDHHTGHSQGEAFASYQEFHPTNQAAGPALAIHEDDLGAKAYYKRVEDDIRQLVESMKKTNVLFDRITSDRYANGELQYTVSDKEFVELARPMLNETLMRGLYEETFTQD